jgi:hypothetical protein
MPDDDKLKKALEIEARKRAIIAQAEEDIKGDREERLAGARERLAQNPVAKDIADRAVLETKLAGEGLPGMEEDKKAVADKIASEAVAEVQKDWAANPTNKKKALAAAGLIKKGNIDLSSRPVVKNEDGSVSTIRSMSFSDKPGREILIPTVVDGKVVSDEEAIKHYRKTGQNLGTYKTPEAANAAAEAMHESEAKRVAAMEKAKEAPSPPTSPGTGSPSGDVGSANTQVSPPSTNVPATVTSPQNNAVTPAASSGSPVAIPTADQLRLQAAQAQAPTGAGIINALTQPVRPYQGQPTVLGNAAPITPAAPVTQQPAAPSPPPSQLTPAPAVQSPAVPAATQPGAQGQALPQLAATYPDVTVTPANNQARNATIANVKQTAAQSRDVNVQALGQIAAIEQQKSDRLVEDQKKLDAAATETNKKVADLDTELKAAQMKHAADNQLHIAKLDKFVNELESYKIDPKRYMANMSTGDKIVAVIGAGLAGFANPHGANIVVDQLNKNIQNDIQAQVANFNSKVTTLQAKGSLYKFMREQGMNEEAAISATRVKMLDDAQRYVTTVAQNAVRADQKDAANIMVQNLAMQAQAEKEKFAELNMKLTPATGQKITPHSGPLANVTLTPSQYLEYVKTGMIHGFDPGTVQGKTPAAIQLREAKTKAFVASIAPNGGEVTNPAQVEVVANNPALTRKASDAAGQLGMIRDDLKAYYEMAKKGGHAYLDPSRKLAMNNFRESIMGRLKNLHGIDSNIPSVERLLHLVPDPSSFDPRQWNRLPEMIDALGVAIDDDIGGYISGAYGYKPAKVWTPRASAQSATRKEIE